MADTDQAAQLLIQSNRADTMQVDSRDGDRIGHVHAYMIQKRTGHALYVILAFGGLMGIGKAFYPLPFKLLGYNPVEDRYVVTIDHRVLEGGPSWASNAPDFDQAYADRVAHYYGVGRKDLTLG
ncbi:MAG: PRC-barrel domain-containing protein [Sphingomonas sp.]|nr:PRC-barrel domain-containing protein [Sphingomonas sp.]